MSGTDPVIDMMELADLGQPRKLAWEIHRQLRAQYGEVPRRVPLAGIAKAVGIVDIAEVDAKTFEGTLIIKDGVGVIGLRRDLLPGRRNFTFGHELGHFLNPWHRQLSTKFQCSSADVAAKRSSGFDQRPALERIEVEANEFAATLLLPLPEFRAVRKQLGSDIDITHVRTLADTFAVSQQFMGSIYVEQADCKAALMYSRHGIIQSFTIPREFPFLGLKKGTPLPSSSLTREFLRTHSEGAASNVKDVPTYVWLEQRGSVTALYEQALIQRDGWATTLLMIDEEEEDDEADDRNWNRRSSYRVN